MKILYTKQFKETISQPWSNISLGEVKLREGTNTGLTKQEVGKVMNFPDNFLSINSTQRTYIPDIIALPGGGIQIYLEIPEEDQSFYDDNFKYQVISFLYTDLLTNRKSLAFVCYQDMVGEDEITFSGLRLTSRGNIITIPSFDWLGEIKFSQSDVVKYLESSEGSLEVNPFLSGSGYVSKKSWEALVDDSISDTLGTPWIETTYINNYGIKIY